jgi:signal recognition particle subunit SRP54
MPEYLVPKGGDADATARLKKFMVIMDSMNKAELDGKVNLHDDTDQVQSRILRIARGSGSHPNEVKLLLLSHKQFEGVVSKMGKSMGAANAAAGDSAGSKLKQQQLAAQMRKNPNLIQQRINQMDPRMLQQMGGRENVMAM